MKRIFLALTIICSWLSLQSGTFAADAPLRVFIFSGPKSHGPGAHDHPAFLRDWVPLLNGRGAKASGGDNFPTKEQLKETDVLIIHRDGGGNFKPEERALLDEYTKRGGGIVVIHAGSVSDTPEGTAYYKQLIGGSWKRPDTKWLEGPMNLYFTDRDNPITKDMSNFEMDDEMYYDMDLSPDIHVLAAGYTPKPRAARKDKPSAPPANANKVSVYDIQPQVWTWEAAHTDSGNKALGTFDVGGLLIPYRAFVCIPGHNYVNFSRPNFRALLLRGIAWAGKHADTDELCKPDELADNLRYVEGGPTRPEKAAEKLEVHPEFNISLVASEPLVNKVMNVDWDEKGRMWVCETPEYPNGRRQQNTDPWKDAGSLYPGKFDREPQDRISWLEDTNGDGVMDKKHVFADKLELATSFCFYKSGVIACSAPDIWFLEDTTGKGVCDKRTKLYTGLGTGDTHAVINNLRWGLDGWVYATLGYSAGHPVSPDGKKDFGTVTSGVVRFKPDGSAFEQYSSKGGNTWGLCMTWDGQCFWTQPTSGDLLMHTVLPESVLAKGKILGTSSFKVTGPRAAPTFPLMKSDQLPYVQIDWVGSFTAAAGCAIYEGGAWPEKWNYSYFSGEPTINIVHHEFVTPEGVTYKSAKEKGREDTEFIRSHDMWFRPIENRVGPDGALYIVDFYNQAVIHNDTRGPLHGPANAAVRPDRDHYFSRIWRVQHKEAKKLEVPVLDRKDFQGLAKILKTSPNAHVKQQAWRLLSEEADSTGNRKGIVGLAESGIWPRTTGRVLELYSNLLKTPLANSERATAITNVFHTTSDNWSRSAAIAAASESPIEIILSASTDNESGKLQQLIQALLPNALSKDGAAHAVKLIEGIEAHRMSPSLLQGIAQHLNEAPVLTVTLADALKKLLANPSTAGAALPLVVKWDTKGVLAKEMNTQLAKLSSSLAAPNAPLAERISAAKALVGLGAKESKEFGIPALAGQDTPPELKSAIIEALAESGQSSMLVNIFGTLNREQQTQAFDAILKRPDATKLLLDAVATGSVNAKDFGPSNIARLRTHPNKEIAKQANAMLDKLISPTSKQKDAVIAKLTPEVEKPGDAVKGKMLFTTTCAICHEFQGSAGVPPVISIENNSTGKMPALPFAKAGPALTGMGAHGPAELLVSIVDPNREVDPSFYAWNFTKKNGDVLVGVIAQENSATVTLRNQAGEFEIRKDDIKTRENTRRSLMPEGFEALPPDMLRDILAYICGSESRYRIVDLKNAYTADTRRGLFDSEETKIDSVHFIKFGNITTEGVPYFIMDPAKSTTGTNIIVLKGGHGKNVAQSYPQKVEVALNTPAKRLHFLSGIAGWGFPAIDDDRPALKVTITHADGQTEVTELKNSEAFGDYNHVVNVPGSELVEGLVNDGQLRRITLAVKNPTPITKLTLESYNNGVSPVVCAITADIAGAGPLPRNDDIPVVPKNGGATAKKNDADKGVGAPSAAPASPMIWDSGKTIVLIVAGGSSHDFKKWFEDYDSEFLKTAGLSVNATEDSALATAELKNADVAIISTNKTGLDTPEYRAALLDFAAKGKGIIMLHPGTWYGFGKWTEINAQIIGGGAKSHDALGPFTVNVLKKDHPVMKNVPASFAVVDELYHVNPEPPKDTASIEVLAETTRSKKYNQSHPSVWITNHDKARIVGIAIGHDGRVHELEAFKNILINAVNWTGRK